MTDPADRLRSAADHLDDARTDLGYGDFDSGDGHIDEIAGEFDDLFAEAEKTLRQTAIHAEVRDGDHSNVETVEGVEVAVSGETRTIEVRFWRADLLLRRFGYDPDEYRLYRADAGLTLVPLESTDTIDLTEVTEFAAVAKDVSHGAADVDQVGSPEEFLEWSFAIRGEGCRVVENHTEAPTKAVVWSEDGLDVPDGVRVVNCSRATGDAPAVQRADVEGWHKYVLELDQAVAAQEGR